MITDDKEPKPLTLAELRETIAAADSAQVHALAPHVSGRHTVRAWYAAHGFTLEPHGPGFYKPFPDAGVFVRVVAADDVDTAPREIAAPVWVTLHGNRDGRELAGFNAPDGHALLVRITRGDW